MTILFLCGSLEPAHDGVGDYTRRLAGELLRQGHQTAMVSLNERNLSDEDERLAPQIDETQQIPTLRLSSRLSWRKRVSQAQPFIDAVNPDVISLQYVPFGFQLKGLPFGFSTVLEQLRRSRPLHIMFHELWLGIQVQSPRQYIGWGYVQQHLIRSMLATQRPVVIHTHTPLYQLELERLGIQVTQLPLFSNIPVTTLPYRNRSDVADSLRMVLFGGAFRGAPAQALAADVAMYAQRKQMEAELLLIGRTGPDQHTWINAWHSNGLRVQNLGEQTPAFISDVLSQSTLGISTTPVALWGKSGAIAAMHAHGLPVVCASAPWYPRRRVILPRPCGILEYQAGQFEAIMAERSVSIPTNVGLANVARQFYDDLAMALQQPVRVQAIHQV